MLVNLSIKNIVLIEKLILDLNSGLSVLTGETGAGKSILIDSLKLALGERADISLIRHGEEKASVTAIFNIAKQAGIITLLKEQDIEFADEIILRRVLSINGKSKAFINDEPVSISLLNKIGRMLVEIHGQFDTHGLLNPKNHLSVLDDFSNNLNLRNKVKEKWLEFNKLQNLLSDAIQEFEESKNNEDYLNHLVTELQEIDVQEDEEKTLTDKRNMAMSFEKFSENMKVIEELLGHEQGLENQISIVSNNSAKISEMLGDKADNFSNAVNRAEVEVLEISSELNNLKRSMDDIDFDIDEISKRLFDLKDCARKHNCEISDLTDKLNELKDKLDLINNHDQLIKDLTKKSELAKSEYLNSANELSKLRLSKAEELDNAVNIELTPLKLGNAQFKTVLEELPQEKWGVNGIDNVKFAVATNLGNKFSDLNKIASGGELSRFMLALKVSLAETSKIPVLIFDEIDSGVGGAVADAIGSRLKKLGGISQTMVVTHSPQVASRADNHLIVSKSNDSGKTISNIRLLEEDERIEEVARMLAGADTTDEARAAAHKLMYGDRDAA